MELIVRSGEREESVTIERQGDVFEVRLGERTYRIDAVVAGANGLSSLRTDAGQYEVAVHREGGSRYRVHTRHGSDAVDVLDPLSALAGDGFGAGGGQGKGVVEAYMPGRVVAVLVEEGAEVEAGQGIVVLEAMKMENEIQAEAAGVVKKLHVAAGDAVDGGDPLFALE
ncbi:MAG: biotin/lipoyl-containing protein [Acidobacteriota bacterium]